MSNQEKVAGQGYICGVAADATDVSPDSYHRLPAVVGPSPRGSWVLYFSAIMLFVVIQDRKKKENWAPPLQSLYDHSKDLVVCRHWNVATSCLQGPVTLWLYK